MPFDTSICFVFFRGLTLDHLDAAWYSLSKQDFLHVGREIIFLDNNTVYAPEAISEVTRQYLPEHLVVEHHFEKHGDPAKTHSWSVNRACHVAPGPWIFFTRADYILHFDALRRMRAAVRDRPTWDQRRFISGWCWQMAYDREARNTPEVVDIEQYRWRERGMTALLDHPYGYKFHETDQDAGVWFTKKDYLAEAGWMNEGLTSWGFQQSTFQRALTRIGITCEALPDYLFAHQHHYAKRDFEQAHREYKHFGGGL